ncbi:hypothetical protein S40288_10958 [Stachybotrys chartarum IBT 40288]|nr:hypothetical protein S40288_10958 [Stachybotrys chartarum IBT 40288]
MVKIRNVDEGSAEVFAFDCGLRTLQSDGTVKGKMENFVWADVCRSDDEPEETSVDGGAAPLYAVVPGPAESYQDVSGAGVLFSRLQ